MSEYVGNERLATVEAKLDAVGAGISELRSTLSFVLDKLALLPLVEAHLTEMRGRLDKAEVKIEKLENLAEVNKENILKEVTRIDYKITRYTGIFTGVTLLIAVLWAITGDIVTTKLADSLSKTQAVTQQHQEEWRETLPAERLKMLEERRKK